MKKKYQGVVVPMVTPVDILGQIDTEAVGSIIKYMGKHGVAPLLMGTTGEGSSIALEESVRLVSAAVAANRELAHPVTIYAALTGNCFHDHLRQAEFYAQAGADVIVATLPCYYALTGRQMHDYYRDLADSIRKPLMLYNILSTTHMSIPVEVIRQLAEHPNIVGLKDSERDLERMQQCIDFTKERPDFSYFCGWAAQSAHSLSLGGDGIVPSTGNYVPKLFAALYQAALRGDTAEADRLQASTDQIAKIYQAGRTLGESLAALKVMMSTKNLCEPNMLIPLSRLHPKDEMAIRQQCASLHLT